MADIRYVCLSDMHLGADGSLLTNTVAPLAPSPVLGQFMVCLRELIAQNTAGKPTLILNGDTLDLAISETHHAAMAFTSFLELAFPADGNWLFNDIVYLPGNHDHHLWQSDRETQYLNFIDTTPPTQLLPDEWCVTRLFAKPGATIVPTRFLRRLSKRLPQLGGSEAPINTFYPNYGLLDANAEKCVLFHHGHFIESAYHLVSLVLTLAFPTRQLPTQVWDIEKENWAWIEFLWSAVGRSEQVGRLYVKLGDDTQRKKLLATLAANIAAKYHFLKLPDFINAALLKCAFDKVADGITRLEKHQTTTPLSPDAESGLKAYMEVAFLNQILRERGALPQELALIFGHTHKPFEGQRTFAGYSQPVDLYNTGGWVVEAVDNQPVIGAAVVLMDQDLSPVSLRLYNESVAADGCEVSVAQGPLAGGAESAFHAQVAAQVDAASDPWLTFRQLAADEVKKRKHLLQEKIDS